jgi:glutaredoxin 3
MRRADGQPRAPGLFRRQFKGAAMAEIIIYTRDMCGYCAAAKSLLERKGQSYHEHNATFDPALRGEMMQRSGRTTFPQIFIDGRHIGGFDDLNALDRSGGLDPLLAARS